MAVASAVVTVRLLLPWAMAPAPPQRTPRSSKDLPFLCHLLQNTRATECLLQAFRLIIFLLRLSYSGSGVENETDELQLVTTIKA